MKDAMRRARKAAGLTRMKLSELSTVAYVTLASWELGYCGPTCSAAILVCDALGISLDEYLGHKVKRRDNND